MGELSSRPRCRRRFPSLPPTSPTHEFIPYIINRSSQRCGQQVPSLSERRTCPRRSPTLRARTHSGDARVTPGRSLTQREARRVANVRFSPRTARRSALAWTLVGAYASQPGTAVSSRSSWAKDAYHWLVLSVCHSHLRSHRLDRN
jgi:hypothetical protein